MGRKNFIDSLLLTRRIRSINISIYFFHCFSVLPLLLQLGLSQLFTLKALFKYRFTYCKGRVSQHLITSTFFSRKLISLSIFENGIEFVELFITIVRNPDSDLKTKSLLILVLYISFGRFKTAIVFHNVFNVSFSLMTNKKNDLTVRNYVD